MKNNTSLNTSIIISIYNDVNALNSILISLKSQTYKDFDIIVSEDNQSQEVKEYIARIKFKYPNLTHLSQPDNGFQKNKALNKSITKAKDGLLIFIDGDCVPHKNFIKAHVLNCKPKFMAVGRRAEIGPFFSALIKRNSFFLRAFQNKLIYLSLLLALALDKGKHIEAGIYSEFLHSRNINKHIGLLGCNFSIYKHDLINVNGFDEDYINSGCGEDTDIGWRLNESGVKNINVKFLAIEYHLSHKINYVTSQDNLDIYNNTRANNLISCKNGLIKR